MCGIAAIINNNGMWKTEDLFRFTDAVAHRGPDGKGFSFFRRDGEKISGDQDFRLGLGHRRLSIIDLSDCGSQPMDMDGANYTIVYNGEIYNYIEIRGELEKKGVKFTSHSDTEVLLKAYAEWGADCLSRFNGMWAFTIFDKRRGKLFISRDRIGVKPLYWWKNGKNLAIASEIKQFFTLSGFKKEVNRKVCLSYLVSGYENPPETFYENIFAFPPGHFAEIDLDNPEVKPQKFWFPEKILPVEQDENEITARISEKFSDAVRLRLRSDVPVGGCLSGGLDSSSIFIEMKKYSPEITFNAFSSCFDDPSVDEQPFMRIVVEKTNSRHIRTFPSAEELAADFDKFLFHHDEPVGSVSMYAQFRVMQSARENKVPVLLDGQGGDELFSGYWPSYMLLMNGYRKTGRYFNIFSEICSAALPGGNPVFISEIGKNFREFRRRSSGSLPFSIRPELQNEIDSLETLSWHRKALDLSSAEYRKSEIFRIHLPRLLKWEDRNSMAFSIESRVPFLDVNLVELLLSVPPEMNMRRGWTKYLFRKSMSGRLPGDICWRRDKKGFETPQEKWMINGHFHNVLLKWADEKDHPVSEFIQDNFSEVRRTLEKKEFNSTALFRLFCMDKWLRMNVN